MSNEPLSKRERIQWEKTNRVQKRSTAKERIRSAYMQPAAVTIIPAESETTSGEPRVLRVAAYCGVSTDDDAQSSSYELQIQRYTEYIEKNPDWVLADIYADEGISGTGVKKRKAFMQMIDDCINGKIDLIVTKNMSRFTRNVEDCLHFTRKLKALAPPVGVYFETEHLNSLQKDAEQMMISYSSFAQRESEAKSESIKWSYRLRFLKGIPYIATDSFLGYDKDKNGRMVINREEARIVRSIFRRFSSGKNSRQIADQLTAEQIPTLKGGNRWSVGSVRNILRNEKYCGDLLMQKTVTLDCLTHKSVRNKGLAQKYFVENHHPPIIQRTQWDEVRYQLAYRRYAQDGIRPKLHIQTVKSGKLSGYFVLNLKWDAYDRDRVFKRFLGTKELLSNQS